MAREYVEQRNGGYYLTGSRVSLESLIWPFLEGASPETLVDEFPTLSLEQVLAPAATSSIWERGGRERRAGLM